MKIVTDSYAWIEHFMGSDKGRKTDQILEKADEVYTPDVVLAEVARKYVRENIEPEIVSQRLEEITEVSNIICVDAKIALIAAESYKDLEINAKNCKLSNPSLFDAIVLAVGRSLKSNILTGDQHFRNLPETVWVE